MHTHIYIYIFYTYTYDEFIFGICIPQYPDTYVYISIYTHKTHVLYINMYIYTHIYTYRYMYTCT